MASTMAATLDEAEVGSVVDRSGERTNRFGQSACKVRYFHPTRNLMFGKATHMEDGVFAFNLLPFEADVRRGDIE